MRQPGALAPPDLMTTPGLQSLRRSLITFIVGGVMRRADESEQNRPERLFSFIVHLERLRGAHADQQGLAQRLIDGLRVADLSAGSVATQVQAAYADLCASRRAGGMDTPSLAQLLPDIGPAFASITTEVVNSDSQLEQLLDEDTGQLRQSSPFNIYIGGQSLDRGVTIANVIGFFYGRDPRVAQQDTTIQHCRMYGDRPRGDLAVTRFYTSNAIYERMDRMHEFDQMLWKQLRAREENGDRIDDPGDVIFLQRDPSGEVSPCSPNKIILTRAQWTRPSGELVPRPFTTVNGQGHAAEAQSIVARLRSFGDESTPFHVTVSEACNLLDEVCSLIRIDDGWDWDLDALKDAVRHLATSHPGESLRDRVFCLYTLGNTIRKWNDEAHSDPQRAPYSQTTERALRQAAGMSPSLGFYHNDGDASPEKGWSGSPFVWPVLFVPDGVVPTVFANNRRNAPRRRRRR
jgi:Z1 domain